MKFLNMAIIAALAACSAMLSGCLGTSESSPSQFYIMNADVSGLEVVNGKQCSVNILPVSIPAYMSRPQLVATESGNVVLMEFNRWAEPAANGFTRTLIDGVSKLSPNSAIYAYPAVSPLDDAVSLRIYINDCIGSLGGNLVFKGRWQLDSTGVSNFRNISDEFSYTIPCGTDAKSYVAAINKAVAMLSADISKGLVKFFNTETK